MSDAAEARSWASWLDCSRSSVACWRRSTSRAAAVGLIGVAAVGERCGPATKPRCGERALHLILAPRGLGGEVGLDPRALVGEAGLVQRELLAAHRVDLLDDLGLAGEHVELEVGIGEDREQLALLDHGAVLDQDLLDPAALDRVEEDGDADGSTRARSGRKSSNRPWVDRRDGEPRRPATVWLLAVGAKQ